MKYILKLGFALMVYCIIAGLALGFINSKTAPVIEALEKQLKKEAIEEVLPENNGIETFNLELSEGKQLEYTVGKKDGEVTGYAVTAFGNGFSSVMRTIVGLKPDFTINKIAVVYQNETPGLGTKCEDEDFKAQFVGLTFAETAVTKDGGKIESITGATITSRALANSIKETGELLQNKLPKTEVIVNDSTGTENDSTEVIEVSKGGE